VNPSAEAVRAFVALDLEAPVRDEAAELIERLRPDVEGARWTRPETLHLTLRFLGAATPAQLERLGPALAAAAVRCPVSTAVVAGLGTFPERGRPRVLWLGLALPREILALQQGCERAAEEAGFAPSARPFRPHLTLARFRERAPRPRLPPADLGQSRFDTLVLYRSDLRPQGALHTPLVTWALRGRV
jgi:2'-5' RNA ligase